MIDPSEPQPSGSLAVDANTLDLDFGFGLKRDVRSQGRGISMVRVEFRVSVRV